MKKLFHITVAAVAVIALTGCVGKGKGKGKVPEAEPVVVQEPLPVITKG